MLRATIPVLLVICLCSSVSVARKLTTRRPPTTTTTVAPETGHFKLDVNSDNADAAFGAFSLSPSVDAHTRNILEQINLRDVVSTSQQIRNYQNEIKAIARTWRSRGRPALFAINEAFVAFSGEFDVYYDLVIETSNSLDVADNRDLVAEILNELKNEAGRLNNVTSGAVNALSAFHSAVLDKKTHIDENNKIWKDKLNTEIRNLDNSINDRKQKLEEIQRRTTTTAATTTTARYVKVEPDNTWQEIQRLLGEIRELEAKRAELSWSRDGVEDMKRHVGSLYDVVAQIYTALEPMPLAWEHVTGSYASVIKVLELQRNLDATFRDNLRASFESAKEQWETLREKAVEFQRNQLSLHGGSD